MRPRNLIAAALLLGTSPLAAFSQSCIQPGATVSIPAPDALNGRVPSLVVAFSDRRSRVIVTRTTSDRIHLRMPVVDMPPGSSFAIYALPEEVGGGSTALGGTASTGFLEWIENAFENGHDVGGGRGPSTGGGTNNLARLTAGDGNEEEEDDEEEDDEEDDDGVDDDGVDDDGEDDEEEDDEEDDEEEDDEEEDDEEEDATGHPPLMMISAPYELALSLVQIARPNDLILAQATGSGPQMLAGGVSCQGSGTPGKSAAPGAPMSPAEVAASLGLGPDGLPPEFRAGINEVPAPSDAPEIVIMAPRSDMRAARNVVEALGGSILSSQRLGNLGLNLVVIDLRGAVSQPELRAQFSLEGIDATVDSNRLFEASQGRRAYANELVGAPPSRSCRLPRRVRVGLIDGPVDGSNPYLREVRVTSSSFLRPGETPGRTDHATGVASLLASPTFSDGFAGIANGADVYSAEVFFSAGTRDVASVEAITKSIDWLLEQRASVINMSIAGSFNRVFRQVIGIASDRGAILVAASGNEGEARVSYPGADPNVIAVTAVDAAKRLYTRASYGLEVEFAAPGVDVLVAEGNGSAYRTGTSYAAGVVSGVIAHDLAASRGRKTADAVRESLRGSSEDLGIAGHDPRFGWGLVQISDCQN